MELDGGDGEGFCEGEVVWEDFVEVVAAGVEDGVFVASEAGEDVCA